ncbi:MAG: CDP-diacylglycerol--serine O-phosphatidyltransferase [Calditrichia bacterium]
MVKVSKAIIPSIFTVLNMFFGFYAVISAAKGNFQLAVWLIFAAAVMDALDGKIARWANASSEFGVEYDSLADVISFCFAPSYFIYASYFNNWGIVGIFISFAPLLFGSLRLARFNIQLEGFDKSHFTGLPSPAAAVAISSYWLFEKEFFGGQPHFKIYMFVVLAVSFLMISNIRYEIFPRLKFDGTKTQFFKVIGVYLGIFVLFLFPSKSLFLLSALYVMVGIGSVLYRNFLIIMKKDAPKKQKANHKSRKRGNSNESNSKNNP